MAHTNKVILAKGIKLDSNYKQVLGYTESQMISLLQNQSHLVWQNNTFNFNNNTGRISVECPYGTVITANYMAFQNTEYSNKWFFAFIKNVIMVSPKTCEIEYDIDIFTTWFDYWDPKQCFIIRQHATTDFAGDNTIPEDIEHGEYISNGAMSIYSGFATYYYVVVTNKGVFAGDNFPICNLGGVPGTGFYYLVADIPSMRFLELQVDGTTGADIIQAYMIPQNLIPSDYIHDAYNNAGIWVGDLSLGISGPTRIDWTVTSSRPTTLNGVTPVNKKLLTYPYQYGWWANSNGASSLLKYELSGNTNHGITISFWGIPTLGGSIIAYPFNYDGQALNTEYSLIGGKFPTLGWSEDAYTNWLTENGVNHAIGIGITGAQIIGGAALLATGAGAVAGAGMLTSGLTNAASAVQSYYEHSKESDSFKGNINGGDILTGLGANTFIFIPKCIKAEYVRKIDKYFTRYGYQQNAVQYPNMQHRENYNYIQIASDDNIGYANLHNGISVPAPAMDIINSIYRSGVTVWNNHANFGDYSVTNAITS